jgi:hypothetical protein
LETALAWEHKAKLELQEHMRALVEFKSNTPADTAAADDDPEDITGEARAKRLLARAKHQEFVAEVATLLSPADRPPPGRAQRASRDVSPLVRHPQRIPGSDCLLLSLLIVFAGLPCFVPFVRPPGVSCRLDFVT